ncbi:hypothetical protein GCM10022247_36090 [Allokutzneria multivorans]|uniref:Uncharacterized protein n=1 Tax=Allokutzneria multivorans TaxID=1142134 RepID=A0ABP7SEE1_9PSEU
MQLAPFLTVEHLSEALTVWAGNDQCRQAARMPELATALYRATAYLGTAQPPVFVAFLSAVQSQATSDDSYYRYPELENALTAAGYRLEL